MGRKPGKPDFQYTSDHVLYIVFNFQKASVRLCATGDAPINSWKGKNRKYSTNKPPLSSNVFRHLLDDFVTCGLPCVQTFPFRCGALRNASCGKCGKVYHTASPDFKFVTPLFFGAYSLSKTYLNFCIGQKYG